jgi:hypothetical protein
MRRTKTIAKLLRPKTSMRAPSVLSPSPVSHASSSSLSIAAEPYER